MGRALTLKTTEELHELSRELGFDPDALEDLPETDEFDDHPISVNDNGDVMRVMTIVSHIEDEIEAEEEALEQEIETVKDFRESRIERKKDTVDYLTQPLQKYTAENGNYNGPAGHAGYHGVTTTNWRAAQEKILAFAQKHGLRQKVTIKAELTKKEAEALEQFIERCDEDADVSWMPYKSAIKDHMRAEGLHDAEYTESGEAIGGNPLYEQETRQDFRCKPEK